MVKWRSFAAACLASADQGGWNRFSIPLWVEMMRTLLPTWSRRWRPWRMAAVVFVKRPFIDHHVALHPRRLLGS